MLLKGRSLTSTFPTGISSQATTKRPKMKIRTLTKYCNSIKKKIKIEEGKEGKQQKIDDTGQQNNKKKNSFDGSVKNELD